MLDFYTFKWLGFSGQGQFKCVGSFVSTSFKYAWGSWPLSLADWIRLITAAAR
jgi:hypothetical protein